MRAAGNGDAAIAAVQQRLKKLDDEVEQLDVKLDAAREAWLKADPGVKEDYKEAYEDLKAQLERLDSMREKLEAQLRPGVCMCTWALPASSPSAAPVAAAPEPPMCSGCTPACTHYGTLMSQHSPSRAQQQQYPAWAAACTDGTCRMLLLDIDGGVLLGFDMLVVMVLQHGACEQHPSFLPFTAVV